VVATSQSVANLRTCMTRTRQRFLPTRSARSPQCQLGLDGQRSLATLELALPNRHQTGQGHGSAGPRWIGHDVGQKEHALQPGGIELSPRAMEAKQRTVLREPLTRRARRERQRRTPLRLDLRRANPAQGPAATPRLAALDSFQEPGALMHVLTSAHMNEAPSAYRLGMPTRH
jgi:hypothetical protein